MDLHTTTRLYTCLWYLKMASQTKPQFLNGWLQMPHATSKLWKVIGLCVAQCKNAVKTVTIDSHNFELYSPSKELTFWFGTFMIAYKCIYNNVFIFECFISYLVSQWCYKLTIFEILKDFHVASALPLRLIIWAKLMPEKWMGFSNGLSYYILKQRTRGSAITQLQSHTIHKT